MKQKAVDKWCRICQQFDGDGGAPCAGIFDGREAGDKPPCEKWPHVKYVQNKEGKRNW